VKPNMDDGDATSVHVPAKVTPTPEQDPSPRSEGHPALGSLATKTDALGSLERFRLSQNFGTAAPVKKLLTTVAIRKPHNQEFIRASSSLTFQALTFAWKEDSRLFLVEPELVSSFPEPLRPTLLVGTINRAGIFYLWPLFLQQGEEQWNTWHRSAFDAMSIAQHHWVRVASNRELGAYETHQALASGLPEPTWPEATIMELLALAFRDQIINSPDHLIVRKLRGEV
jgi:hypothetical protein